LEDPPGISLGSAMLVGFRSQCLTRSASPEGCRDIFMMASVKQLFCTFPGQCSEVNLSSKRPIATWSRNVTVLSASRRANKLLIPTQPEPWQAVINYFQHNTALFFLFSIGSTQSTGSKMQAVILCGTLLEAKPYAVLIWDNYKSLNI